MGAFTAPLVFVIQTFALLARIDNFHPVKLPANPWLEFHASFSLMAYGAFALAGIAWVMYLVQERQLKTHHLHSIFYHLPPLTDLFAAITRLLWWGFALYTLGLISGFFVGEPLPWAQIICAIAVWILYGLILQGRHLRWFAPKRVAALCIIGVSEALALLWGIAVSAMRHKPWICFVSVLAITTRTWKRARISRVTPKPIVCCKAAVAVRRCF